MSALPPPLRFLAVAVGGWACLRAALLAPHWWLEQGLAAPRPPARLPSRPPATPPPAADAGSPAAAAAGFGGGPVALDRPLPGRGRPPATMVVTSFAASAAEDISAALPWQPAPPVPAPRRSDSRWSASAWLLLRRDAVGPALAPGGTLGGSQAGGRLLYRLNRDAARPLSLSGRLYLPLRQAGGAEAAAGLDWRPFARLPVSLLAERRQALGPDGRSAFSLTVYGGHGGRLPGGLRFDAYAQAGIVGVRSRDLFVDGAVRLGVPIGPVEIGAGAWGAAQPGAERLDAGPQASFRLPIRGAHLRLSADWRFRLAGDAAPGSGPALTVASDF